MWTCRIIGYSLRSQKTDFTCVLFPNVWIDFQISKTHSSTSMFKTITINPLFVFQKGVYLVMSCCFNYFKLLFLQPFQGTRAGYHGSRSSTSAVGDWGRNFPCEIKDGKSPLVNRWLLFLIKVRCWFHYWFMWSRWRRLVKDVFQVD